MKTLIIAILTILTFGFVTPKNETVFIGKVTTSNENKDNIIGLYIEFRIDTLVIARNCIQQDGTFKISATSDKEFDIYYRGIGVNDTYVQTIKPTDQDTVLLTFQIPKDYKKNLGKVVCPKCNKHDQTIPIIYGLKTIIVYENDPQPYTTYEGFGKEEIYDGGCSSSGFDAQWYCKRDKIKF